MGGELRWARATIGKHRAVVSLVIGLVLLAPTALAADDGTEQEPALEALAWMVGSWGGRAAEVDAEEHWIAPKAGTMLGLHRDVSEGRTVFFEYLRIEVRDDGIFYVASPKGRSGVSFRLVEHTDQRVVFENPDHDFPQRILYWLAEDGALNARIEGLRDGRYQAAAWRWEPLASSNED